jgi:hypothetical protein
LPPQPTLPRWKGPVKGGAHGPHSAKHHSFTGVRTGAPLAFSSTTTNLAGSVLLGWQDGSEAAKAWFAQLRASGPPPSPNLGVVMGPDFVQLSANLGRNLMEGRLGILTAVFEVASTTTRMHMENR